MAEERPKISILPCNGVGRVVSTVVRQASYRIAELRPKEVVLLSSPAIIAEVPEFMELFLKYPVVAINGCRPRCASGIMERKGKEAAVTINVWDVAAEDKLSIAGESRVKLTQKGLKLVEAIAQRAVKEIDKILGREIREGEAVEVKEHERELIQEILSRL